jgi:uncharacterized protein (DUF58 family)
MQTESSAKDAGPSSSVSPSGRRSTRIARNSLASTAKKGLSPIRTRITREGFHFLFMLTFVLIGAVLRDVNLLVVLAGVLMAMLLLQWRICLRSIVGIRVKRYLPTLAQARVPFEVRLQISNRQRWLGAWLVVVGDRIRRLTSAQHATRAAQSITLVASSVPPSGDVELAYRCHVDRRGKYEFGPIEISTRFPLSLIRSIRKLYVVEEYIVHPPLGEILPRWRELFDIERFGARRQHTRAGVAEGEFYGLRGYRPGDSPRWIHWRTTARRNELVVKQFERQENHQACILLDMWLPKQSDVSPEAYAAAEEHVEAAIEFVASVTNMLIGKGQGSVTVGICDNNFTLVHRIQSRNQVTALLDRLSTAEATHDSNWDVAAEQIRQVIVSFPHLIVISTRENPAKNSETPESAFVKLLKHTAVTWVDASKGGLDSYFRRSRT